MPEVLGEPPSPRTALFWNGTAWQWGLVDAAGHLQIDVITTVMDAAAATAANQALILAQLQLIEDMRDALQSVNTDRLQVRGEDQLFSYESALAENRGAVISGASGFINSDPCAANEIWIVTNIEANDLTSPTTRRLYNLQQGVAIFGIGQSVAVFAALENSYWNGHVYLDPTDSIRVYFTGGLIGDNCRVIITGYRMTLET